MKKTRQLVTIGLLATGLVALYGCSSDAVQGEEDSGNIQPVELKIRTSVEMARATSGTVGVVTGEAFKANDAIAVYAHSSHYNTTSNNNAVYTAASDGSSLSWSAGESHIYLSTEEATIYAVYPSTLTVNASSGVSASTTTSVSLFAGDSSDNKNASTITLLQNNPEQSINAASGETDYMYATASADASNNAGTNDNTSNNAKATAENPNVTLTMHHALALVTFRFYKDNTFAGAGKLTKIALQKAGDDKAFKTSGATMNISSGAIDASSGSDGTLIRFTNSYNKNDGYEIATLPSTGSSEEEHKAAIPGFSMLVYPNTSLADNTVKAVFTIDEVEYPINIPAASSSEGSHEWAAGYNTTYTVKMKGKELGITSVTVTDWQTATVGDELVPIDPTKNN